MFVIHVTGNAVTVNAALKVADWLCENEIAFPIETRPKDLPERVREL